MNKQPSQGSYLFLVRVWPAAEVPANEQPGGGAMPGWQGKVQPVFSNDVHYFQEWTMLVKCLLAMLPGAEQTGDDKGAGTAGGE